MAHTTIVLNAKVELMWYRLLCVFYMKTVAALEPMTRYLQQTWEWCKCGVERVRVIPQRTHSNVFLQYISRISHLTWAMILCLFPDILDKPLGDQQTVKVISMMGRAVGALSEGNVWKKKRKITMSPSYSSYTNTYLHEEHIRDQTYTV